MNVTKSLRLVPTSLPVVENPLSISTLLLPLEGGSRNSPGGEKNERKDGRGGGDGAEKTEEEDRPKRGGRCVAAIIGPRSFCEADRSVGHCLEMIATRSGLLKI